jgi:flagellar hook-basal body protein
MASFATSLSGLQANSQDLSVISNNLANLNTTAYKGASAAFQDLFYQQIGTSGDGNPIQIGVGTTVGSVPANFTEGNIQSTGVPTDVAIQGSGFFIGVNNGQEVYIRAGNLSIQPNGTLVSSDGSVIQGYGAVNGVINTNQTPARSPYRAGRSIRPVPPPTPSFPSISIPARPSAARSARRSPSTILSAPRTFSLITSPTPPPAPGIIPSRFLPPMWEPPAIPW